MNTAFQSGLLNSGLEHFILFGATEGRLGAPEILIPQPAFNPASFDEDFYLQENPDVAAAVTAGVINSGLEHYQLFGQFEGRVGRFFGTSGNDIVTAFGEVTVISGVGVEPSIFSDTGLITSEGVGEIDVLIGGDGIDLFFLGNAPSTTFTNTGNVESYLLYVGGGNNDFALIQNFDESQDIIFLSGSPEDFSLGADGGNFIISTVSGDLISIVEGQTELTAFQDPFTPEVFFLI